MTRAEYDQWKLEHDLVAGLVAKVEAVEQAILVGLKLPPSPEAAVAALQAGRIKRGATSRDRRRASHAIVVLVQLRKVRQQIGPRGGNPRDAAHAALLAGLHAGDSAIVGIERIVRATKGGKGRGKLSEQQNARNRKRVQKAWNRWASDDELQFARNYKAVPWLAENTGFSTPTVRKHLIALGHADATRPPRRKAKRQPG
jgi:hypothetical protein